MNANDVCQLKCPSCKRLYDVRQSILAFSSNISRFKRLRIVFALCPDCMEYYRRLSDANAFGENIRIVRNAFMDGNILDCSVTSDLCLAAHGGNHVNAIILGVDIPRVIFDAYNDGLIEDIALLPG